MSYLTLIVADKRAVLRYRLHYRTVLLLMEDSERFIERISEYPQENVPVAPYDGGIATVDKNHKAVLLLQSSFGIHHIGAAWVRQGWRIKDYFFGSDIKQGIREYLVELNRCGIPAEAPWEWNKFSEQFAGGDL